MRDHPMIGKRVRLDYMDDVFTDLKPGDEGVVNHVDDLGTLHVHWDKGSRLGLVPDEDRWTVLPGECDCVASEMKRPIGHVPGCPAGPQP